jgi:hypothetical protein
VGASERWNDAVDAVEQLHPADQRVLVRWIVAEQWMAFTPQPCQVSTRARTQAHTSTVLAWMAQVLPPGAPGRVTEARGYGSALARAQGLGGAARRSLLALVCARWRERNGATAEQQLAVEALAVCLRDMERQQAATNDGWTCAGTAPAPTARSARRRR